MKKQKLRTRSMKMPDDLWNLLKKTAVKNHRSAASMLQIILMQNLERYLNNEQVHY